jgi:hypothetical protein
LEPTSARNATCICGQLPTQFAGHRSGQLPAAQVEELPKLLLQLRQITSELQVGLLKVGSPLNAQKIRATEQLVQARQSVLLDDVRNQTQGLLPDNRLVAPTGDKVGGVNIDQQAGRFVLRLAEDLKLQFA